METTQTDRHGEPLDYDPNAGDPFKLICRRATKEQLAEIIDNGERHACPIAVFARRVLSARQYRFLGVSAAYEHGSPKIRDYVVAALRATGMDERELLARVW